MTFGLAIDPVILLASTLLVVGIMVVGSADRLKVPASMLALGLGMLVGSDVLGLVYLDDADLVRNLSVLALIVILFEGGLTTKPSALREAGAPGFVLSNLGVVITGAVTAVGVELTFSPGWETSLLLGAVVASTDAAVVFDLLRRAPLPRRLANILEVESGANDPFTIVLTIGLIETFQGSPTLWDWVRFGSLQLLGGVIVGALLGLAGVWLLRTRLRSEGLYPLLALGIAALSYGVAAWFSASGFLAVYVAGLIIGALARRRRRIVVTFHTSLANGADLGLFLLLGILVFPTELPPVMLPALAVTAILLFVARPLAVVICMLPFRLPWREQVILSWAGLRGAVPIVLATFPASAGVANGSTIFNVVFFVVLTSTLLQATTVAPLARRLGLETTRPAWDTIAEALPLDEVGIDLAEIQVRPELPIVGKRLRDAPVGRGMLVASIIRGSRVIVPTGGTKIEADDVVLISIDRSVATILDATAWARGERTDGNTA